MTIKFIYRPPCLHLGGETLKVSLKLFAVNRERLCKQLKEEQCPKGAVVVLQGGEQQQRYCTDTDEVFRQVRFVCLSVYVSQFMFVRLYVYACACHLSGLFLGEA